MTAPISRIFIPYEETPPEVPDSDLTECTTGLPPYLDPVCPSTFQAMLNYAAKRARDVLMVLDTHQFGVQSAVYNPIVDLSVYRQEDEGIEYPVEPDWTGLLLIKGLTQPAIRFGGEDQWDFQTPELWHHQPDVFTIKEQAKIVVNHYDLKLAFRALNKKRVIGVFVELVEVWDLIPFN